MAKTVYTPEEIELQDGTPLILKPLPIAQLKRAMNYIEESPDVVSEEDSYDFILGIAKICVGKQLPEKDAEGNEYDLEESLDLLTGKRIVAVCTGVDFDNPNLAALAMDQTQTGQS
jgi:hypothetical protein